MHTKAGASNDANIAEPPARGRIAHLCGNGAAMSDAAAESRFNWQTAASVACVGLVTLAAVAPLAPAPAISTVAAWQWAAAFAGAALLAVIVAAVGAYREGSFAQPKERLLSHVSGWDFFWLAAAVLGVLLVANWAASSGDAERAIHVEMGRVVVVAVALLFVIVVLASWEPAMHAMTRAANTLSWLARPVGQILSGIDTLLVLGVARSAGANIADARIRFGALFATLIACAVMGYWLEPPWGLIPIFWGFLVAVSMSRSWAWVEDDRELAMMSGRYYGDHLRLGFRQNYRAEALWAFTALFLLVPLALRQAQLGEAALDLDLFDVEGDPGDLWAWIGFYGTELAKAVPFVDWAEVYHVEGRAPINARTPAAQHAVFITRVIVDLLLLATLLQALAVVSRNRRQRELFYDKKQIFKLDPFTESVEFRKLRIFENGSWSADTKKIADFPTGYDPVRIAELSDERLYPDIYMVARELRLRDSGDGKGSSQRFYEELTRRVEARRRDAAAIESIVDAIAVAGVVPDPRVLDNARRRLNRSRAMNRAREKIMTLIAAAPVSNDARYSALVAALRGNDTDSIRDVRAVALHGLRSEAENGTPGALEAIRHVIEGDASTVLQDEARGLLVSIEKSAPPPG